MVPRVLIVTELLAATALWYIKFHLSMNVFDCEDFWHISQQSFTSLVGFPIKSVILGLHLEFFAFSHLTLPISLGRQQTITTFPVDVTRTTFYSEMSAVTGEYYRSTHIYFFSNKWFTWGNLNLICECIVLDCFRSSGTNTSAILEEHIFGVSLLSALIM